MIIRNKILKFAIIFLSIILIATHTISILTKGFTLNQLTLFIIVLFCIAALKESKLLYFISFLSIGILCILTVKNLSDLSPTIFLFLAITYYRKAIYIIPGILIPSYVFSYYINDFDSYANLIEGIIGNLLFLILYCLLFLKQPTDIKYLSIVTPLSKRQLLILKKLSKDIPRKQIPSKTKDLELWSLDLTKEKFTIDIINSEISKIKKTLNINNEMCLGIWYRDQ